MPRKRRDAEDLGDYEMDALTAAKVDLMIAQADDELETRINFRWGKSQLALVKKVAGLMGVPYQTYIKQVLYRQAQEDLRVFLTNHPVEGPVRD